MKPNKYVAVFGVLNALALLLASYSAQAASKERTSQRGSQADTHMSPKVQDTKPQWSADPERGWVRTDDPQNSDQQKKSAKEKKTHGKPANEHKLTKH